MRNRTYSNNLDSQDANRNMLYKTNDRPILNSAQLNDAKLVKRLPRDFPVADWESMNPKAQLKAMQHSGLSETEQWALLNATAPLSVLNQHNQVQDAIDTRATATRIATTLMSAAAKADIARTQATVIKPTNSTPLQTTAQQRKLDMKQEEYETRFYEKQARRPTIANTPNSTPKTPEGAKPVVDSRDAMEQKKDKLWDKIESTYSPRDAMDRKKDEMWDKVNGKPLAYPAKPVNTPLPQPGASPIIPGITPTPYPASAEYAYAFYTDNPGAEFSKQAKYQKQVLEKKGYTVKLICTDSVLAFSNAWNNMDPKTGAAVIISHSNGMSLLFEDGTKTNALSASGRAIDKKTALPKIGDLKGPELALLYILACNAGHQELLTHEGTNVADAFRDLPNVDKVYAYDGSVGFGIPYLSPDLAPRLALDQRGYFSVYSNFDIPYEFGLPSGQLLYDDEN